MQFYPRKRAAKVLHSVNWAPVKGEGILGFIVYKVGMATAIVRDQAEKSMSYKKQIAIPVTVLEAPNMKIYSVRFYKNNRIIKELAVSNDKELKRKLRAPKQQKSLSEIPQDYDDIKIIVYSIPKQTTIKKTPDILEIAISSESKLDFVKEFIGKEISLSDFLKYKILDIRGVTIGKGFQGPVKRFGITLKQHKSEKGIRRPGSLGPWHPARVTFRTPMAGQLGFFSRITYNSNLIASGKISEKNINPPTGFKNYGNIKTSYLIVKGSVQGPAKRPLLITPPFRPSKTQLKKKYEFVEVLTK